MSLKEKLGSQGLNPDKSKIIDIIVRNNQIGSYGRRVNGHLVSVDSHIRKNPVNKKSQPKPKKINHSLSIEKSKNIKKVQKGNNGSNSEQNNIMVSDVALANLFKEFGITLNSRLRKILNESAIGLNIISSFNAQVKLVQALGGIEKARKDNRYIALVNLQVQRIQSFISMFVKGEQNGSKETKK